MNSRAMQDASSAWIVDCNSADVHQSRADENLAQAVLHYARTLFRDQQHPAFPAGEGGALIEAVQATIWREFPHGPSDWIYFRVAIASDEDRNRLVTDIGAELRRNATRFRICGWWWLNKTDLHGIAIRLRVWLPPEQKAGCKKWLQELMKLWGHEVTTLIYEPELRLFGGSAGMELAHKHFCADSEFVSRWLQQRDRITQFAIPPGLSLALVIRFLGACRLDVFECWDVFDRVEDKRAFPDAIGHDTANADSVVAKIIASRFTNFVEAYGPQEGALLKPYGAFLDDLGSKISKAYFAGALDCGVREFLVPIILFHWNRAGFPAATQYGLAAAAARVLRHLSRKGHSTVSPE